VHFSLKIIYVNVSNHVYLFFYDTNNIRFWVWVNLSVRSFIQRTVFFLMWVFSCVFPLVFSCLCSWIQCVVLGNHAWKQICKYENQCFKKWDRTVFRENRHESQQPNQHNNSMKLKTLIVFNVFKRLFTKLFQRVVSLHQRTWVFFINRDTF